VSNESFRVTVCELPSDPHAIADVWPDLVEHCRAEASDVLLLPEMPFAPWLPATKEVEPALWEEAIRKHAAWEARLGEPGAAVVLGSRPVVSGGQRLNESFVWEDGSVWPAHLKRFLPEEDGFWEATWYSRGADEFLSVSTLFGRLGFLVCTELWFTEHARAYARQDAVLLATPRSTEWSTRDRWLLGGRVAAVMSGAFGISSNRGGTDETGFRWGGLGWVVDPGGEVLATTSEQAPFATVTIDPLLAIGAKSTYPRYVAE
jgi:N-carbamoylputrescine amidase